MKRILALILMLCLLCSGCSAKSESADMNYVSNGAPMEAPGVIFDSSDRYYAESEKVESGSAPSAPTAGVQNQKLIRTMSIDAETNNLDDLLAALTGKISLLGGYVEEKSVRTGGSYRYANLTVRIPVDQLDAFVEHVAGQSNILSQTESADDVTLTYVATQSRIIALETEQTRLLELLAQAKDMSDLLLIEERLTNVRYELEQVTSQLRLYDNLVDYGTLNLSIREVKEYTPVAEETFWQRISGGFVGSLKNMGNFLVELCIFLIVALPYLALPAVILVLVIVLLRRKKRIASAPRKTDDTPTVE